MKLVVSLLEEETLVIFIYHLSWFIGIFYMAVDLAIASILNYFYKFLFDKYSLNNG